jgi:hypothetical protein
LLEDEGLISVFSGVIPKIDPRITCYTVNTTHPLVQSILDQDQSKMNQDQSIMDRDQSILDHENAGKSRGSKANGPRKEQQRVSKDYAAARRQPDEDQIQETWLAALPEPERLAVDIAVDSELDRRGREVRNRHALRALILGDFQAGRRPMPEISEGQYELIQSFRRGFADGDEAVPAGKAEDAEPIQPEVLTYDEEMAQLYETMEESHAYH